jgi:lipopolysaccharide transport system permease protein
MATSALAQSVRPILRVTLWRHRDLIIQLVVHEIKQRYRGMYLGLLWSVINPVLLMLVYTFVFSVVLKARWGDAFDQPVSPYDFALTLLAGLIPFSVFSEVLNAAPSLVLRVPNYVKRVVFPLEVLPIVSVGSALIHSALAMLILVVGTLLFEGRVSPAIVWLPLAYLPLILLCLASSWLLSSLGVYVRDVGQTVGILTQVLMFLSPVFYPPSAVPQVLRPILALNPLTGIVDGFRRGVLWNQDLDWGLWAAWMIVLSLAALATYVWFMNTKHGFADVM